MSSKLPFMFVSYQHVPCDDNFNGQLPIEHEYRMRHWCYVSYQHEADAPGERRTIVGQFLTQSSPDFCGGLYVYSPRVSQYSRHSGWYRETTGAGRSDAVLHWSAIDEDPLHTINADVIQETWTSQEIEEYMWQSMACAVISQAMGGSKRVLQAADRDGGQLSKLFEYLDAHSVDDGLTPFRRSYAYIREVPKGLRCPTSTESWKFPALVHCETAQYSVECVKIPGVYNLNSGNHCNLWTGMIQHPDWDYDEAGLPEARLEDIVVCPECHYEQSVGDIECQNCGYENEGLFLGWYDEDEPDKFESNVRKTVVPEEWKASLESPKYWAFVEPHMWGNG